MVNQESVHSASTTIGFGYTMVDNAHLRLMLLEDTVNKYLGQIKLANHGFVPKFGYGLDKSIIDNYEDLLNHMSRARVAKIYNELAEACLQEVGSEAKDVHLKDVGKYLTLSVGVSPPNHVERGRGYILLGVYYLLKSEPNEAEPPFREAIRVFENLGMMEQVSDIRKLLANCQVRE